MDNAIIFSNKLTQILKENKISMYRLGKLVGTSTEMISNYCNGVNKPSLRMFFDICNELSVSADFLLGFSDNFGIENKPSAPIFFHFSKRFGEFLSQYEISQQEIATLLNVSNSIVSQYCKGVSCPRLPKFITICKKYFHLVTANYLLGLSQI